MNKQKILDRLKATIDKLEVLEPEKFEYNIYVSKFNKRSKCGTVCCIAGWYPKWFPDSDLVWDATGDIVDLVDNEHQDNVDDLLSDYHGLSDAAIDTLFYGHPLVIPIKQKSFNIFKRSERKQFNKKLTDILNKYQSELEIDYKNNYVYNSLNSDLPYVIDLWKLVYDFVDQDII